MQFHNHGGTEIAQIQIDEGVHNANSNITFKTGGTTTGMTLDKDGQITKPLQVILMMEKRYCAINLSHIKILYLVLNIKICGSNFDGTTFTAPVTGVYSFSIGSKIR